MYRQALIIIFLAYTVSANNLRTLNEVKTDQIYPSVEDVTTGTRTCPGSCMELVNNNTKCILKKCYSWNKELNECEETGPKFVPALVLQAIPVTGVFGAGGSVLSPQPGHGHQQTGPAVRASQGDPGAVVPGAHRGHRAVGRRARRSPPRGADRGPGGAGTLRGGTARSPGLSVQAEPGGADPGRPGGAAQPVPGGRQLRRGLVPVPPAVRPPGRPHPQSRRRPAQSGAGR